MIHLVNNLILYKSGTQLKKGYVVQGAAGKQPYYNSGKLYSYGYTETPVDTNNGWYYNLADVYDEDDDLWFEVVFKTPETFECNGTGAGIDVGFFDATNNFTLGVQSLIHFRMLCRSSDDTNYVNLCDVAYHGDGSFLQSYTNDSLQPDTKYKLQFAYSGSGKSFSSTLFDDNDSVVHVFSDNTGYIAGELVLNAFGIIPSRGGASESSFVNNFQILSFKAVAGTGDVTQPFGLDHLTATVQIKQSQHTDYTDISTRTKSIKIRKRINESSTATVELINSGDLIQNAFTPNTELKIRLGKNTETSHAQFIGYIPPRKEFYNVVHIKGKDETYTHTTSQTLFGHKAYTISPASDDYPPEREDSESSEQEDMFKAQKFQLSNSRPLNQFKSNENVIKIQALDYISKYSDYYVRYDEVSNLDNYKVQSAFERVITSHPESPLKFVTGGTDPKKNLGDTKGDWKVAKKLLDDWLNVLESESSLPNAPTKFAYYQSNFGVPTFVLKEIPSTESAPVIIKTIAETDILGFKRNNDGGLSLKLKDSYWLDLLDTVYPDTDEYGLRGIYNIVEIIYTYTTGVISTEVVLEEKINMLS